MHACCRHARQKEWKHGSILGCERVAWQTAHCVRSSMTVLNRETWATDVDDGRSAIISSNCIHCKQNVPEFCGYDSDDLIGTRAVLSQGVPRDAAVNFDTYRSFQPYSGIVRFSLQQHGFCIKNRTNHDLKLSRDIAGFLCSSIVYSLLSSALLKLARTHRGRHTKICGWAKFLPPPLPFLPLYLFFPLSRFPPSP